MLCESRRRGQARDRRRGAQSLVGITTNGTDDLALDLEVVDEAVGRRLPPLSGREQPEECRGIGTSLSDPEAAQGLADSLEEMATLGPRNDPPCGRNVGNPFDLLVHCLEHGEFKAARRPQGVDHSLFWDIWFLPIADPP